MNTSLLQELNNKKMSILGDGTPAGSTPRSVSSSKKWDYKISSKQNETPSSRFKTSRRSKNSVFFNLRNKKDHNNHNLSADNTAVPLGQTEKEKVAKLNSTINGINYENKKGHILFKKIQDNLAVPRNSQRRPSIVFANLGGNIAELLNKDKNNDQTEILKTQNKDLRTELKELKTLNEKLMDRLESLENEKQEKDLKLVLGDEDPHQVSMFNKTTTPHSQNLLKSQLRSQLLDQKHKYTGHIEKMKEFYENKIKELKENHERVETNLKTKNEELSEKLKDTKGELNQVSTKLKVINNKEKNSIAQKFIHISRSKFCNCFMFQIILNL